MGDRFILFSFMQEIVIIGAGRTFSGTGLSNIKAVAEKYNGLMSVKVQDMAFVLNVLLIIPRQ